jgi:hypothetical protein
MPLVAVTGSQRPYIFDLPQLLSLPDGFEFRFRYHRIWVADDLEQELESLRNWKDVKPSQRMLAGETLFLVFHSQEQKRLAPVRCCTIIGIEPLGPMVFVRFRVGPVARVSGEVVAAASSDASRAAENARLNDLATKMLGLAGYDLSQPLPKGGYLRRSAVPSDEAEWVKVPAGRVQDDVEAWASVAALLQREPQLNQVPFFRLIGFQQKDGEYRDPEDISRSFTVSTENTKGFKLIEGERYRLRLLEWCETIRGAGPGAAVTATVPQDLLSLEGASNLVVGKYDVLEFACMARRPGYGELAIRVEPPKTETPGTSPLGKPNDVSSPPPRPADPWPYFYVARVPIHVRHNRLRLTLLLVVGALGIGLYLWGPAVPLLIAGLSVPREVGQLAGLVMMFTALGEYLQRFVRFSSGLKDLPLGGGLQAIK